MTNKIEISRELAEAFDRENSPPPKWAVEQLRALVAAPAVERQEPVAWIVTDMNGDSYFAYDKQTPIDQPLYTSPTAPVAVVLPTILSSEQGPHYSDNRTSELGYLAGYNACLDKVKEMNK